MPGSVNMVTWNKRRDRWKRVLVDRVADLCGMVGDRRHNRRTWDATTV